MDTKKLLMGTVVGGITYFILGFLIYGILLAGMMQGGCMRAETDMVWWAMIAGNLGFAMLLSYVFLKSGVSGFGGGAQVGATIAFLVSLSIDLMMYATTTVMADPSAIAMDVAASAVMGGLAGGVIAMVISKGGQAAA